jgi:hypothetical protein
VGQISGLFWGIFQGRFVVLLSSKKRSRLSGLACPLRRCGAVAPRSSSFALVRPSGSLFYHFILTTYHEKNIHYLHSYDRIFSISSKIFHI